MLSKSLKYIGICGAAIMTIPFAAAQSGSSWSFDGQTRYASYQACEQARQTRTLGGAAIGGAVGAGLGAFAGGNDTRNAIVGGVIGAVTGGAVGRNQVRCEQIPSYNGQYSNHTRYDQGGYIAQRAYQPTRSYSSYGQTQYSGYSHSGTTYRQQAPTRYYGHSGHQTYRTQQPTYQYQQRGYSYQQPTYSYRQPARSYQSTGFHQPSYGYAQPANVTTWTYDGRTQFRSQAECERARRNRTVAGGGLGAVAGAGLGALAGGDDGRNAVVGGVLGAAVGAYAGNRSLRCYQRASGHGQYRYR